MRFKSFYEGKLTTLVFDTDVVNIKTLEEIAQRLKEEKFYFTYKNGTLIVRYDEKRKKEIKDILKKVGFSDSEMNDLFF